MAKDMKYFLFFKSELVLRDATENSLEEAISNLARENSDLQDSDLVVVHGRSLPVHVETGVRVKLTKRVSKGKKLGRPKANGAAKTTETLKTEASI